MPQRRWIVDRDRTDHGGTVVVAYHGTSMMGYEAARVGDKVWCPRCKTVATILHGEETFIDHGQPRAYEGCYTSCGARLISVRQRAGYFDDGSEDAGVPVVLPSAELPMSEKNGICLECLVNAAQRASAVLGR